MPVPDANNVPDLNVWKPVQRMVDDAELRAFAANTVALNGASLVGAKLRILDFLGFHDEAEAQGRWSDYWGTLLSMHGLGYTDSEEICHATALAEYLCRPDSSVRLYYLMWALRFQYPYAQNKSRQWKEAGKVVLPFGTLVAYLLVLADLGVRRRDDALSYLAYDEVTAYVMPEFHSDFATIVRVCHDIAGGRPPRAVGSAQSLAARTLQFKTRWCSVFEKTRLLEFRDAEIVLAGPRQRMVAETWLRFMRPPFVQRRGDETARRAIYDVGFGTSIRTLPETLTAALAVVGGMP